MQKQLAAVRLRMPRLTASETVLAVSACVLGISAFVALPSAPLTGVMMLLAAAAIIALVHERVSVRRALGSLAEQLDLAGPVGKLEVELAGATFVLGHALNRVIQRARTEASESPFLLSAHMESEAAATESRMVAALHIGVRQGACVPYSIAHTRRIGEVVAAARQAGRYTDLAIKAQGDGTLVLLFGARHEQARALSLRQALDTATALSGLFPELRFGLACGEAGVYTLPSLGSTVIGAPLDDAARLGRMAAAWHEYRLLAAEPVALMARAFASRRTPLELSLAAAPALPVYVLDLEPSPVALSA